MSDSITIMDGGSAYVPNGREVEAAMTAERDLWQYHPRYFQTLRLLLLAGFCLLCVVKPASGDDIFKATGRYAISSDHYVVMFTASWCGPCNAYKNSDKFTRLKARFPVTVVDVGIDRQWSKHVGSVPTFWLARRSDRKVLARYTGSTDVSIFVADVNRLTKPQVRKLLHSHAEMVELHDRLHGGGSWTWPGDLETHLRRVHNVEN
jgi:thiol-disulfide isomerase/thioredoxin